MTENGINLQTISTKRSLKQADRFLLIRQVTILKALPSHFLKFLSTSRTNSTFGFTRETSQPFAKPKEPWETEELVVWILSIDSKVVQETVKPYNWVNKLNHRFNTYDAWESKKLSWKRLLKMLFFYILQMEMRPKRMSQLTHVIS